MTTYKSDAFFGSLTGNGRILVVDDDSDVRRAIRLMLEKAGYDILEAADGQAAIEGHPYGREPTRGRCHLM